MKLRQRLLNLSRVWVIAAFCGTMVLCMPASAQITGSFAFWKNPKPKLIFSTSSQTLASATCSGQTTIVTKNAGGATANVASNLTVTLSGPAGTLFFSDSGCMDAITSITVLSGTSSASFYFMVPSAGSPSLVASATGYISASQSETLSSNAFVWTGTGPDTNWTSADNWSGHAVPGPSDVAVFKSGCTFCNATLNGNPNVGGVRIWSTYSGILTQSAGVQKTIGTSGWRQAGGTFQGNHSVATINGPFSLSGGSYKSTSSTWKITGDFTIYGSPTFNHNSGTYVVGNGTKTITPGGITFNHVTFEGGPYDYNTISGTMTVAGNLVTPNNDNRSDLNGGTISVAGDVAFSNAGYKGTTTIRLAGSTNQSLDTGTDNPRFPRLEIASTGGTVTLAGSATLTSGFLYTSGTVTSPTFSVTFFNFSYDPFSITSGPVQFMDVIFSMTANGSDIVLTDPMTVNGNLSLNIISSSRLNGSSVSVKGNLSTDSSAGTGSTTWIKMIGSTDQSITGTGGNNSLPNLEIASTGGTVTLATNLTIYHHFTYASGNVATTGGTNVTFLFAQLSSGNSTVTPGLMAFADVTFANTAYGYGILVGTMTIKGSLTLAAVDNRSSLNGGTIALLGDLNMSVWSGGNTAVTFKSAGSQTITSTGGTFFSGNVTVAQTGFAAPGVGLVGNLTAASNWTVTKGPIYMNGYNLTINGLSLNATTVHKKNMTSSTAAGVLTVGGSVVGNGSFFGGTIAD